MRHPGTQAAGGPGVAGAPGQSVPSERGTESPMSMPRLAPLLGRSRSHCRPDRQLAETGQALPAARRPRLAIPWGVIGAVVLVAGVESFVASRPLDFSDPVSLNWRLSAADAAARAPGCAVLCVGDSLVKHAVVPSLLERQTGLSTWNLALARGPAPAAFFLLRRALEAGARPESVVVDFKPSVLVGSPRYNLRYWQEILTPRETLELARTSGGGSLFVAITLGRILPSYRSRLEVRQAIAAALKGEKPPMRPINRVCRRNWTVNQGANVAARNPEFLGSVSPEQHKTLLSHLWYCHRANRVYVRRFLELTEARGIRVYWLLPPLAPELLARREQTGAEAGYETFVQSFVKRFPHLTVVDARHSGYVPSVFVDPTHLDGLGARTVTADLAALLRQRGATSRPASRWVALPPFRTVDEQVALEDVEQSKRRLQLTTRR